MDEEASFIAQRKIEKSIAAKRWPEFIYKSEVAELFAEYQVTVKDRGYVAQETPEVPQDLLAEPMIKGGVDRLSKFLGGQLLTDKFPNHVERTNWKKGVDKAYPHEVFLVIDSNRIGMNNLTSLFTTGVQLMEAGLASFELESGSEQYAEKVKELKAKLSEVLPFIAHLNQLGKKTEFKYIPIEEAAQELGVSVEEAQQNKGLSFKDANKTEVKIAYDDPNQATYDNLTLDDLTDQELVEFPEEQRELRRYGKLTITQEATRLAGEILVTLGYDVQARPNTATKQPPYTAQA